MGETSGSDSGSRSLYTWDGVLVPWGPQVLCYPTMPHYHVKSIEWGPENIPGKNEERGMCVGGGG